ncbi:type II toxin-antitoxin system HicB family antitoxin [Hymenobacter weizhouensis]|uniref:type II toxin-antitoxin system HicB family antitoxin n=1 Tax=Hymenobacter sp. YIM 151500-1 TaxID=2987689 RepID=UPI0022274A00|nr:type II toxin-antitoxin system HicB family antitoxin [Hymenobacter sp. YIM 151500-1]UYZ63932.1 type II toxin-antitoxin system HicB family antitoxin [Hymenobacter sp. YIM 151500-1]
MDQMQHYPVVIFWSAEDQAFLAEVPDLPGCMADGKTQAEALANAAIVIEEWLETARELNRPIPAPRPRLRYA